MSISGNIANQGECRENRKVTAADSDTSGIKGQIKRIFELFGEISSKNSFVFLFCGFLGAISFTTIFGTAILDFTYTDWLMTGGDTSQHYIGWRFFRASDWHSPIGLMDNIIYPFKTSVIYTDSIPMFAVIFKLLSPILPTTFQYFGLFGLLCYFMQGAASGLIMKRLCNSTLFAIIGSMFFILSPTMLFRMYEHTALGAHFIILLCIYACITKADKQRSAYRNIAIWGGLLCLASVTHLYFIPMILIFMFFYFLDDCIESKKIIKPVIEGISGAALMLILLACMGAFSSGGLVEGGLIEGGLGYFSANLLSMLNPSIFPIGGEGMSTFLKDMPLATDGQYEGNGYLGLGAIMGCLLFIIYFLKNFETIKEALRNRVLLRRLILSAILFAAFFVFALSPTVTFRDGAIFTYPVPGIVRDVWAIFRATGRFIWIPAYIVMFAVIWAVRKEHKIKLSVIVLAILLSVQVLDLKGYFTRKGGAFTDRIEWNSPLPSSEWDMIAEHYQHIVFFPEAHDNLPITYAVADIAVRNNMTLSDFYLARKDSEAIEGHKSAERRRISSGDASEGTIYFVGDFFDTSLPPNLHIYEIDNVFIGVKVPIAPIEEVFIKDVLPTYEMQELVELAGERSPYQFQGWSGPEKWGTWTDDEEAAIALEVTSASDLLLHLNIANVHAVQPVDIYVNGLLLGSFVIDVGENVIEVPSSYIQNNILAITFSFNEFLEVAQDSRKLGIAVISFYIAEKMD